MCSNCPDQPDEMLPVAMWVFEGDSGTILCDAVYPCKYRENKNQMACYGCPVAYRFKDGMVEYWKVPIDEVPSA